MVKKKKKSRPETGNDQSDEKAGADDMSRSRLACLHSANIYGAHCYMSVRMIR